MAEQEEEVEVIQFDNSLPRQLFSPLNYLEFDNYSCCPPLSPQKYSSGSDLYLWDFSADRINSHSTGDTQFPSISVWYVFSLLFSFFGMVNNKRAADLSATYKYKIICGTLSREWFAIDSSGTSSLVFRDSRKLSYAPGIGDGICMDLLGYLIIFLNVISFRTISVPYSFTIDSTDKLPEGASSSNFPIYGYYTCEAPKVGDVGHNLSKEKRVVDDKLASRIESIPTYQANNATLGPEALQNGEESGKTYSVEQQRVLKFDSGYDRKKISDTRGKNPDPILKKARDRITREDLEQHFELPLNDAAERLGFSRSTLKRLCREHDIPRWPSHKKKRINIEQNIEHVSRPVQEAERALAHTSQSCGLLVGSVDKSALTQKLVPQQREASVEAPHPVPEAPQFVQHETPERGNTIENIDTVRNLHAPRAKERVLESSKTIPPDSYPPKNKVVESFPSTNPSMQVAAVQETRKITIKARYMDVIIKFPLSSSSGIAELQKEVIKRLKLRKGKFTIKYLDIDQDWILIACNEDLQACLSAGTGAIQMLIQSK